MRSGERVGGYLINKRIHVGDVDQWLEATSDNAGTVELQLLLPHVVQQPEIADAFHRYAESMLTLRHDNIVRAIEVGVESPYEFVAYEGIPGARLSEALRVLSKPPTRLDVQTVLYIADTLSRALTHAHQRHVLHRAMSLENVVVDADGGLRIRNFGINVGSELLSLGPPPNPNRLAAPEVLLGAEPSVLSDQFDLATVIHIALAAPIQVDTVAAYVKGVRQGAPLKLGTLRDDIPDALDEALARAMHKQPWKRFASIDDFAEALKAVTPTDETKARKRLAQLVGLAG